MGVRGREAGVVAGVVGGVVGGVARLPFGGVVAGVAGVLLGVLLGVMLHAHEQHRIVAALHAVLLDGRACVMGLLLALN